MKTKLQNKEKGFTIIEVLIVLAIAGLIMLIVFLAVPALQRNSRNTQRTNDASLVVAAVNECINNKNGQLSACNSIGDNAVSIDNDKLRQLSEGPTFGTAEYNLDKAVIVIGSKCSSSGDGTEDGTARQFAVTFAVENSSGGEVNRCIDG